MKKIEFYKKFDKSPFNKKQSHIYFIILPYQNSRRKLNVDGKLTNLYLCKIGTSVNPKSRISDLLTGIPFEVDIKIVEEAFWWKGLTARDVEVGLSRLLYNRNAYRNSLFSHGAKEWFLLTKQEIDVLCEKIEELALWTSDFCRRPFSELEKTAQEIDASMLDRLKSGYWVGNWFFDIEYDYLNSENAICIDDSFKSNYYSVAA